MRSRNIKPGFFKNEALAEINPPWGRVLFMGLWGMADKEGRLLDRPGHIAVEVFPYDLATGRLTIAQVGEMLSELAKTSSDPFILRYERDGRKIIQIKNFQKHQSPHNTEKASELPPYQEVKKRKHPPKRTVDSRKSNGEATVDSRKSNGENPPDSLNPDSLNPEILNPDSLYNPPTPLSGGKPFGPQDLAVLWNEKAPPELSPVHIPLKRPPREMQKIRDALKRNLGMEWWEKVLHKMHNSPFLRGRNDKGWKANFDFMVKKAEEILDGKYDEGSGPEPKGYRGLRQYAARQFLQREDSRLSPDMQAFVKDEEEGIIDVESTVVQ